VDWGTRKE
jgi:hypothetical protein